MKKVVLRCSCGIEVSIYHLKLALPTSCFLTPWGRLLWSRHAMQPGLCLRYSASSFLDTLLARVPWLFSQISRRDPISRPYSMLLLEDLRGRDHTKWYLGPFQVCWKTLKFASVSITFVNLDSTHSTQVLISHWRWALLASSTRTSSSIGIAKYFWTFARLSSSSFSLVWDSQRLVLGSRLRETRLLRYASIMWQLEKSIQNTED